MSVDLYLRAVTLAMIEQGQTRRPLLSSAASKGNEDKEFKLLQVRYKKVQKESPEYMTRHEGVDQSVDVDLSTFNISIAPEPILSLYDFIMTTFVPQDEHPVNGNTKEDVANGTGDSKSETEQPVEQSPDKIRVRVKLTSAQGT